MKPVALRFRLLLLSVVSTCVALAFSGVAIAMLFNAHVESRVVADLSVQFDRLVNLFDPEEDKLSLSASLADPAFATPLGGRYWQITDPAAGSRLRSRSMWDTQLDITEPGVRDGALHILHIVDAEGAPAIAAFRRLTFVRAGGGDRHIDMIVAEDLAQVAIANREFQSSLFISLGLLALFLSLASWVQITLGLSPLAIIQEKVAAIRSGQSERLSGRFPREVVPLVSEVNDLLDAQEKSIAFARSRAADLAHGLKTSLTVLNVQAQQLHFEGNTAQAEAIENMTVDMSATIDHQLRLARLNSRAPTSHFATPLQDQIDRVVTALVKTPVGQQRKWTVNIPAELSVDIERADLIELLGIVLENAAHWAKAEIRIDARREDRGIALRIKDDGPGLTKDQIEKIGQRGVRLDSQNRGTGIGLSIAHEIAALNGGTITFNSSPGSGLTVAILLNGAPSDHPPRA